MSPADDLSLSEGKRSLLSELKLYTDTNPHCNLQSSVDIQGSVRVELSSLT